MKITIDNIPVEVNEGTTVLDAASSLGIHIPTMCYKEGHTNHPSCMVCTVKDLEAKKMIPSCAMPVREGMQIQTHSPEIREFRREALELLLSDHVGDCEAPCRLSCPAFMNIPLMNRLIAGNQIYQALQVVREEIPLPFILGYICPAPCEKACRRKVIDEPVSICLLKRFTASASEEHTRDLAGMIKENGIKIAIIGSGPAGLSSAFFLRKIGYSVTIFERQHLPGGSLRYSIPEEKLPKQILDAEIKCLSQIGIVFKTDQEISPTLFEEEIIPGHHAVIIATGEPASETFHLLNLVADADGNLFNPKTLMTSRAGIFGCGSVVTPQRMAVQSVAQGKRAATETDLYLSPGKQRKTRMHFRSAISHFLTDEAEEYMKESSAENPIHPEKENLYGYDPEQAIREAARCMHCDCRKPVSCKLRLLSEEYHANRKRYATAGRKRLSRHFRQDILVYEPEKCIKCGLCIEITSGNKEPLGLTFIGRGFDIRVGIPLGHAVDEGIIFTAKLCADSCPTGALSFPGQEEEFEEQVRERLAATGLDKTGEL